MSVNSMTGYGLGDGQSGEVKIYCQIRTVNHRYFDWKPRFPQIYLSVEEKIKSAIKKSINRGAVEVFIKREDSGRSVQKINEKTFLDAADALKGVAHKMGVSKDYTGEHLMDWVLTNPDVYSRDGAERCSEEEEKVVVKVVQDAVKQVCEKRLAEGNNLKTHCEDVLKTMSETIKNLEPAIKEVPKLWKEKLNKRLAEWTPATVPEGRLEQEMILMAEKMDVSEELIRLDSHFKHFKELLKKDGPKGKKLDFFIQEIHREINTIGSKISDSEISVRVMELKSYLEQMREQVQNIE